MEKWADYLISEVSYDSEHLIYTAIRHHDSERGISEGEPIDRLTIASDIKNGLLYLTLYSGKDSWKKGHKIHVFSIDGSPYLRIDKNKVKLDYLGDLPETSIAESESIKELELKPEPEPQASPRGTLPKESAEELSQELDLAPEPITEPEEEEATPAQLEEVKHLEEQIDELEDILSSQKLPEPEEEEATPEQLVQVHDLEKQIDELEDVLSKMLHSSSDEPTVEQISKVQELEKEIQRLEDVDIEHEIIQTLQKQNKKLDKIEKKLHGKTDKKSTSSDFPEAYCVKCRVKRKIKNPKETTMKNGRPAIKGNCSVCNCKVFRIGKMKKK